MGNKKKILITDDDAVIRQICTGALRSDYELDTADDGVEALEKLATGQYDLMILDVWMPRKTGLEVLSELKSLGTRTRVIVLTSDTTSDTVLQAIKEQAYYYIQKPFEVNALREVVEDAVAEHAESPPIEVISATDNWVELLVPCERSVGERLPSFMRQLDASLSEDARDTIGMAFNELLRNAMEWGGHYDPNRKVRIAYLRTERMIMVRIADPGGGFDPEKIDHAAFAFQPGSLDHVQIRKQKGIRPGGFGIVMVEGLVDELIYNEARNEVAFIQYLDKGEDDE